MGYVILSKGYTLGVTQGGIYRVVYPRCYIPREAYTPVSLLGKKEASLSPFFGRNVREESLPASLRREGIMPGIEPPPSLVGICLPVHLGREPPVHPG